MSSIHSGSRGFTPARQAVAWVRVSSLGCAKGSSGSVGFAWVHSGAPTGRRALWVRALLVVVGFILVHVGSFLSRLGVVGFIRVNVGSLAVVGFLRFRLGSRARLGYVEFIRNREGSLGSVYVSSSSFGFSWVHSCSLIYCRVHSGSLEFTLALLSVVGFI